MTRRLHIERLELDLRGVAPATAEAAARLLGPALSAALAQQRPQAASAEQLDAGRIRTQHATEPQALATQLAQHIAQQALQRDAGGGAP